MTDYGVTPDGFVLKPFEAIDAEVSAFWREKISKHLQLTEKTVLGNVGRAENEQIAALWELAQAAYQSFDVSNADEAAFVALCELTGVKRFAASKGRVATTCNFDASKSYAPGDLVAHVAGQASNRWVNKDQVTTTTAGNYSVAFEAETAGAAGVAQAGTLTVIAQSIDGWHSVTNALKSDPDGTDVETLEALELRRQQELGGSGARTLRSIVAQVSEIPGVLNVSARQNRTDVFDIATALPPHSIQVRVWDGAVPAASNNSIAQAIFDSAGDGIQTVGNLTGLAFDSVSLTNETMNFSRAVVAQLYVNITVQGSVTVQQVKDSIVALAPTKPAETVVALKIKSAPLDIPGAIDVTAFTLGLSPSPTNNVNVVPTWETIIRIDPANIAVTIV